MKETIRRFLADQSGATAIEYGLICALIFLVIVGAVTVFGNATAGVFNAAFQAMAAVI